MPTVAERIQRVQVSKADTHASLQWIALTMAQQFRRGLIDMRKRFRGNQPISVSRELEGGKSKSHQQLYAGKPAFETVKEISGDEVRMDPEKTRGL